MRGVTQHDLYLDARLEQDVPEVEDLLLGPLVVDYFGLDPRKLDPCALCDALRGVQDFDDVFLAQILPLLLPHLDSHPKNVPPEEKIDLLFVVFGLFAFDLGHQAGERLHETVREFWLLDQALVEQRRLDLQELLELQLDLPFHTPQLLLMASQKAFFLCLSNLLNFFWLDFSLLPVVEFAKHLRVQVVFPLEVFDALQRLFTDVVFSFWPEVQYALAPGDLLLEAL